MYNVNTLGISVPIGDILIRILTTKNWIWMPHLYNFIALLNSCRIQI
jgi:hypothetical protein